MRQTIVLKNNSLLLMIKKPSDCGDNGARASKIV